MELWLLYGLISALFGGLFHFTLKISAQHNHNSSRFTFYSMISTMILAFIFLLSDFRDNFNLGLILLLGALNTTFYFISTITRIDSLKYIDTSIYYPLYKTFTAFLVLTAGFILFNESVNIKQGIGIAFGVFVPILLINKNSKNNQKDIKKGLLLLLIGIVMTGGSSIVSKTITTNNLNILYYIFFSYFIGALLSDTMAKRTTKKEHNIKNIKRFGYLSGIFMFFNFYFFLKALENGILGIVYIINSFSIVVPVILSVIIYKENLDFRKSSALVLSIVAIIFLR